MGCFVHACEGEMVCESINTKIPYFNAPIYLENKTPIGKVDEILGPLNQVYFTIKPQEGIVATSFKTGDKFYIGGDKLLPLEKSVGSGYGRDDGDANGINLGSYHDPNLLPANRSQSGRVAPVEVVVEAG
ncbi:MAG: H/ACA snoRNP pseudouridylase subunit [Phylliscum demangeonii]|nr:MAG: H/ACA snoRNP pseudouridylase subunit [Phylliscum demangeonii]